MTFIFIDWAENRIIKQKNISEVMLCCQLWTESKECWIHFLVIQNSVVNIRTWLYTGHLQTHFCSSQVETLAENSTAIGTQSHHPHSWNHKHKNREGEKGTICLFHPKPLLLLLKKMRQMVTVSPPYLNQMWENSVDIFQSVAMEPQITPNYPYGT